MGGKELQVRSAKLWALACEQHGVIARSQLLGLGLTRKAIEHRIEIGRLHPLWRGVYAVGRPEVDQFGRWMAVTLSCGSEALLSHRSAAALWGLLNDTRSLEVVIPGNARRRRPGIRVHRRSGLAPSDRRVVHGIPVTDPTSTLVDLASCVPEWRVERAINEADRLDLAHPETLRAAIQALPPRPGMACMRRLLGCDALTDSGLERKFLAIAQATGLPQPETQAWVSGYRVDFYWPQLGLVAEADSWRYHRTAGQQATDHRRDQAHSAAGLTTLRFPEDQIRYRPDEVIGALVAVAGRLGAQAGLRAERRRL